MSVLGDLAGKRFWFGVLLTAVIVLTVTAICALLTVAGVVPPAKAWTSGCAAWTLGSWLGGRFAVQGKDRMLARSVLNAAVTATLFWVVGLTTPGVSGFTERCWIWYLSLALIGAVAAAAMPQKRKRRRRGKRSK